MKFFSVEGPKESKHRWMYTDTAPLDMHRYGSAGSAQIQCHSLLDSFMEKCYLFKILQGTKYTVQVTKYKVQDTRNMVQSTWKKAHGFK